MRFSKVILVLALLFLTATVFAQEGNVVLEQNVLIPRDASFGDETLSRGTYRMSLTEISGEMWFVVKKGDQEVARDIAIELPASELPTQGLKTEILKGEEYFRVRVRRGDKVYLVHFLLKDGKA